MFIRKRERATLRWFPLPCPKAAKPVGTASLNRANASHFFLSNLAGINLVWNHASTAAFAARKAVHVWE